MLYKKIQPYPLRSEIYRFFKAERTPYKEFKGYQEKKHSSIGQYLVKNNDYYEENKDIHDKIDRIVVKKNLRAIDSIYESHI